MFDGCLKVLSMEFDDGDFIIESSNDDTSVVGNIGRQEVAKKIVEGISVSTSENVAGQENGWSGNHDGGYSDFEVSGTIGDVIGEERNEKMIRLSKEEINLDCQGEVGNVDENETGCNNPTAIDGDKESEMEIGTNNGDINVDEGEGIEQSEASECDRVGDHENDEELCQVQDRRGTASTSTIMSSSTDLGNISIHRCTCQRMEQPVLLALRGREASARFQKVSTKVQAGKDGEDRDLEMGVGYPRADGEPRSSR
ncbi:hypothetical protein FGB62_70g111 [Gracilaria domingensis]|nr:hypothetical protein FGB62_70g111 [Gracilaria domingensis]